MNRAKTLRSVAALAMLCFSMSAFAALVTSNGTGGGNWNQSSTWITATVPTASDTVVISGNDVVTVTDAQFADTVSLDTNGGSHSLVLSSGGYLTISGGGAALNINPASSSTSLVQFDGGTIEITLGGVSINGELFGTGVGRVDFNANGGLLDIAGALTFGGNASNAQLTFLGSGTPGIVKIGSGLQSGGSITSANSIFEFDGNGLQVISGPYTLDDVKINKTSGTTAQLSATLTINGDLDIQSGNLDDNGNQITVTSGLTKLASGTFLELGGSTSATLFPMSNPANVTLNAGSTVVYKAGVSQGIDTSIAYQNLSLETPAPPVNRTFAGTLTVNGDINVDPSVTLNVDANSADLNGNLLGDGTVTITTGAVNIAGNWNSTSTLVAGTGTVTYDGSSGQSVVGGTYHHLVINNSGIAFVSLQGPINVTGDLTFTAGSFFTGIGSYAVDVTGNITTAGTLNASSSTITLDGNWTNTGGMNTSSATLDFAGTAPQTFSSTSLAQFGTVNINNATGVTISGANKIMNALNLNAGNVTSTGTYLAIEPSAVVTRTSGHILGELTMGFNLSQTRRFDIGTATAYLPVDVTSGSSGYLEIGTIDGQHPNQTGINTLDRYWTFPAGSTVTPLSTLVFNYNQSDFTTGDETKFGIAQYSSPNWTQHGDVVAEAVNTATLSNVSGYTGDWVIGQRGSTGSAGIVQIIDVNGGADPGVNVPFDVIVQSQYDNGSAANVSANTNVLLDVIGGTGTLGGTTSGSIIGGTSFTTLSGVTYDIAEPVTMEVTASGGDPLDPGTNATFDVLPTTLTVTTTADSGAGSLRAAITTANAGGCADPCTIDFDSGGTGTITLASPLPAITTTVSLTIDGYSGAGSNSNVNGFGFASTAVVTVILDGNNLVATGLEIQTDDVAVRGLAFRNFNVGGAGRAIFINGGANNKIGGCLIGNDGTSASPNHYGIVVDGATATQNDIGGTTAADRNVISGNMSWGVHLTNSSGQTSLQGNYIGVNAAAAGALLNGNGGVLVDSTSSLNNIGTNVVGNVISGHSGAGVGIDIDGSFNTVKGNRIGTDGAGTSAIANGIGINVDGVDNYIGGAGGGDRNIVSGNTGTGIVINGDDAQVSDNYIGVGALLGALGNGSFGILVTGTSGAHSIGLPNGNIIANNTNAGVGLSTTGSGTVMRTNEIYANGGLAIDLDNDGITANDLTDSDSGNANNRQNFPTISGATVSGGSVNVTVSIDSSGAASTANLIIDVYKADTSSPEEALEWLGDSGCISGSSLTNYAFTVPLGSATAGDKLVVTATNYEADFVGSATSPRRVRTHDTCNTVNDGTSELSAAVTINSEKHWIAGSGTWETAGNWSPAGVPTSTDDVFIDAAGTYTVTINTLVSVNSLTVGDGLGINTQTLDVTATNSLTILNASTVTTTGILTLNGNSLSGAGSLTVFGTLNWPNGIIAGAGGLTIKNGAALNLSTGNTKALDQRALTIENGALATWTGGNFQMQNAASVSNAGTFQVQTGTAIANGGAAGSFTNTGTFQKSGAVSTTTIGVDFDHSGGLIDIDSGTLDLTAGGTATAGIDIVTGAEVLVSGGTYALGGAASVSNSGTLRITNGQLDVNGSPTTISVLQLEGTGTLGGTGTLTYGTFTWNGGTMSGSGTTQGSAGSNLTLATGSSKSLARTLDIQFSAFVTVTGTGALMMNAGSSITNAGTWDSQTDFTIGNGGGGGTFTNTGTFKKSTGAGALQFASVVFDNNGGQVQLQSGSLDLANGTSIGGTFDLSGGTTLLINSDIYMIESTAFPSAGLVQVSAGTLTIGNTVSIPNFSLIGGVVDGFGTLILTGTASWTGGNMQGTGSTTIPNLGTLTISTATAKTITNRSLDIQNGGTVNWSGGVLALQNGGAINNAGLFQAQSNDFMSDAGAAGAFTNNNIFRKSAGVGTTTLEVTFANNSSVEIITGSLDLAGGTSGAGSTIDLGGGTTLEINSDNYTFDGTAFPGTGAVNVTTGGTLSILNSVSLSDFTLAGGTLNGTGMLTLTNLASWSSGSMQGSGTTTIAAGANLAVSTAAVKTLITRALDIQFSGTIDWSGGTITMSSGAAINNAGLFHAQANDSITNGGAAGSFTNTGELRKTIGTGTTTIGIPLSNSGGLIDLQTGILNASASYTQNAGGTLKIHLGGTTAGTQHSQLATAASPALDGTLQILLVGLYEPNAGDTFRVLSFTGAPAGDFTQPYTYPALSAGKSFSDAYDASGLLLTVSGDADLSISKTASPTTVVTGAPITYTITVNNPSANLANSVQVVDTLPPNHTAISASGTGWTCNVVTDTVTCTANASLGAGNAPNITINANAPATPTSFTNTATVSSSNDSNAANNSDGEFVTVSASSADVSLSGSATVGPLSTGTPHAMNFTVNNDGPQTATNVTFTATIPTSLTYNSATIGGGTCNFVGQVVTCTRASLSQLTFTTVTINVTTLDTGTQVIPASVTASEADPDTSDNGATYEIGVVGFTVTVVNTNDSGTGSLRQALLDAQSSICVSPCSIDFNIPAGPFTIQPLTDLPGVTSSVTLDATTQPGYSGVPIVEIDGSLNPGSAHLLLVNGTGSTVRGFSIINGVSDGIHVSGSSNTIDLNYLGLDSLIAAAGNATGVQVTGNNNTIGGAFRNIISGNTGSGVLLSGTATGNIVAGNYIGTNEVGLSALGNDTGIEIFGPADANTIGGALPADGNLISGNATYGIHIQGSAAGSEADSTIIRNNAIGPDSAGTAALGAGASGIAIDDHATGTIIDQNTISGNQNGIVIGGATITTNITDNLIGVAPDGTTAMGNPQAGIVIGASNNIIGGTSGAGNVIANNGSNGITVTSGSGNEITGNSISNHPSLGIDLGGDGLDAIDAGDADTGANGKQNSPTLTSAVLDGLGNLTVNYTIDSSAASANSILAEFFEADSAGSGEGRTFLARVCTALDAFSNGASFAAAGVAAGDPIVLTATSFTDTACATIGDGTSEFSNVVTASACAPAAANVSGTTAICSGGSANISASLTGTAPFTINWSDGFVQTVSSGTTAARTVSPAGTTTYTITSITDASCAAAGTGTGSAVITVNPTPTAAVSGTATICAGGSTTISANLTGTAPFSLTWSDGFVQTITSGTVATRSVSPASNTTYTITTFNDANCSGTPSGSAVVTVNPIPTATVSGSNAICAGGSTTISANLTGTAPFNLTWSDGFVQTISSGTLATRSVSPASDTTYTITTFSDANCTGTSSGSAVVTVNPAPTATVSGSNTICAGGSTTISANLTGTAPFNLTWSDGFVQTVTSGLTASRSVSPASNITYTITTLSDASCAGTSSGSAVVTVNPLPAATVSGGGTICAGGSTTISANLTGNAPFNLTWSDGFVQTVSSGTLATRSVSPASNTTYTIASFNDASCTGTSSGSAVVTVNPVPTATVSGGGTICAGNASTINATLTGTAPFSLTWSDGFVQTVTSGLTASRSVSPSSTATYTITTLSDASCSGTSSGSAIVTVNPNPIVTISGATATCASTPVTLNAGGGYASYSWSTGETTQSITVTPLSTATYTVNVVDTNGCPGSDTHMVTVSANPTATIIAPASVCQSSASNSASVASQAGATYAWTITNGTITSPASSNAITFTAGASGNVVLGVTVNAGSCTSTGSATIPTVAPPNVTITGPTTTCPSNAVVLDAGAGFTSYVWSTGATSQTITVAPNATTTYSVTVTNAANCASSDTHTVTVGSGPGAIEITSPPTVTPNQSGLTASVASLPGATYVWTATDGTIDSGQGTSAITFTSGGAGFMTLGVTVTLNGCTSSDSDLITVSDGQTPASADLGITKTGPASVQAGASIVYTITVTNNGPDAVTDATMNDVLPSGVAFAGTNGGTWTCVQGAAVQCFGALAAGASNTITITVTAPQQAATLTNSASVSASPNDPNPANNSASVTTIVIAAPPTCATTPASLVTPANNATVNSPATFTWSAVNGALEYELWIDDALAGTTAATSLTVPVASGAHSWFVVVRLTDGCDPLASAERTFTVAQASGCETHGAPQMTGPIGSTVSSPALFSWTAVPQAIGYRVFIEVDGTAPQDIGTTDGAISLTANVPPGAIVAYVDALFSGCPATRSQPISFNVAEPDPCAGRATAQPASPANNATVNASSTKLAWTSANGAEGYRVWFSLDGATPAVLGTTTSELSLRATFAHGTVIWWVEALYPGCASTESQRFRFTIPQRSECTQAKPEAVSPPNNTTVDDGNVTFTWTSPEGTVSNELWLSADNGTFTLLGTTEGNALTRLVPPGNLRWFIRSFVDRCPSRDSQTARFTHQPPANCVANQRPIAIAPVEDAELSGPIDFSSSAPNGAASFDLFVVRGDGAPQHVASNNVPFFNGLTLAAGHLRWFVRAHFDGCSPLDSVERALEIVPEPQACAELDAPLVTAPGQISSGVPFLIQWNPIAGATSYQLQLASDASFDDAQTITTTATQHELTRTNNGATPLAVHARVRAIDGNCEPAPQISAFGPSAAIFILSSTGSEGATPLTGGIVTFTLPIGAQFAGQTFTATAKEPWLTVTPAAGVVGANGTTLTVVANTTGLPPGTSLGAVTITLTSPAAGNVATNGTTITIPTISVSLVTPVTPSPKSAPPPDALIIPAVAHADGINSKFQSDVRVSNTSPQVMKYQITFTPSGGEGIATGKQTTFSIEPGRTIALDDVLKSWFGTGTGSAVGVLEIRPLTQTTTATSSAALSGLANLVTFASSRTFNLTANGTFGQYIPAIPFANFVGKSATNAVLSLQQIAQSAQYRTNLGLLEGSGQSASLLVKVFGETGQKLTEFPVNLNGGQHVQLNGFLAQQGINTLSDGRVEVEVLSPGGKVTAYASVLDNKTNDPLLVTPVTLTETGNTKWVMPGVADLNNGFANWQTDMRVFNAGTEAVDVTFSFHSQGGGAPKTATASIPAGQVKQFDKTLATLFGVTNDGGAVHIATPNNARLIATSRTFNQTTGGTYGQFISAVTPLEAAGVGTRPLQLLQVEESARFRSNIGLAEVTGNPVKIEISVVPPDAKFSVTTELTLQPNEFRQLGSLLKSVGLNETFNARVTVRAVEGTGRVTAYASVIDALTNDPTLIPAQ